MYARVNTLTGVTDMDRGVAHLDQTAAELAQMSGYRGLVAAGDRRDGRVTVIGLWENLDDLEASDSAVAKTRHQAVEAFGGSVTVEVFEVLDQEVGDLPPTIGCPVLSRRGRTNAEHLEAVIAYARKVTIPALKTQPGFRAMLGLLDRERYEAVVGIIFADMESLTAAQQALEPTTEADLKSVGGEPGEEAVVHELLFAHTP